MFATYKKLFAPALILLLCMVIYGRASAQTPAPDIPQGFYIIAEAPSVHMYQKDYQGGSPDYVQMIDLSQGAQIVLMHGEVRENRPGKGVYGGDDPRILSLPLKKYWGQLSDMSPNAFCVTNGQFFYMKESPTRLPFPLKVDGAIVTDGYGINDFPDKKLILEIWQDRAFITNLSQDSLYYSDAPDIVAGLTQTASKRIDQYVGRTFVGIDDRNQDGSYETVLIFNSSLARQVDAANVLESFGADQVMMLDGGGSTQLSCQGKSYIFSERLIPQAIGVISAPEITTPNQSLSPDPAAGETLLEAESINPGNSRSDGNVVDTSGSDSSQPNEIIVNPQNEADQPLGQASPAEPLPMRTQRCTLRPAHDVAGARCGALLHQQDTNGGAVLSSSQKPASLHCHAFRQVPRLVDIQAAQGGDVVSQKLQWDYRGDGSEHPGSIWQPDDMVRHSSDHLIAIRRQRNDGAATRFACSIWLNIFSYQGSRGAITITGISRSISAIGPCFISPAG